MFRVWEEKFRVTFGLLSGYRNYWDDAKTGMLFELVSRKRRKERPIAGC